MQFNNSYFTSMDKEAAKQYLVNPSYLGITTPPFEKQLGALQAKIFEGAANVELGFLATGKGSLMGGKVTPEMHSKEERADMRELAKFNKVGLSTHAAITGSLAGFTEHGFKEQAREAGLREIKRAIDFAADVTDGGPVVVHTGEFPRPIHGTEVNEKGEIVLTKKGKPLFTGYEAEEKEKVHYLVNKQTGEVFKSAKEDESIWVPETDKDSEGNVLKWEGVKAYNPLTKKDEEIPKYVIDPISGDLKVKEVTYEQFKKEQLEKGTKEKEIPKEFLKEAMKGEIEHQLGSAHEFELSYAQKKAYRDKYYQKMKEWEEFEKTLGPGALEKLKEKVMDLGVRRDAERYGIEMEKKTISEILNEIVHEADKQMRYGENNAISARKQAERLAKQLRDAVDITEFSLEKTGKTIAQAAMHAYGEEKKHHLKEPLFIAPENIFPEQYGAHPDELRAIIDASRKAMVEDLKKNMSEVEAKKIAEDHIKATFDIGHANTWKKYFQGSDEEFKKWIVDKAKTLYKEGYIGHVHVTDNFGYEDEHLGAGEGNAPIREFVEELMKQGYKGKIIAEVGAQDKGQSHQALLAAMRSFNSPIYSIGGVTSTWNDLEHSYFGKVLAGPSYVVGAYAPDADLPTEHRTWTFWSGVPME